MCCALFVYHSFCRSSKKGRKAPAERGRHRRTSIMRLPRCGIICFDSLHKSGVLGSPLQASVIAVTNFIYDQNEQGADWDGDDSGMAG
jgi:hypothetical protein